MKRRTKMFAVVPTLLTLGNLVCGFLPSHWNVFFSAFFIEGFFFFL